MKFLINRLHNFAINIKGRHQINSRPVAMFIIQIKLKDIFRIYNLGKDDFRIYIIECFIYIYFIYIY